MKNKRYLNVRAATKNLKKDILLRHIKTVHGKLKMFECQICKKCLEENVIFFYTVH